MNKTILIGRLTADADVRYSTSGSAVARFTLAVDRRFKKEGEPTADFIRCTAFGKTAEFLEKFGKKGTKFAMTGRIATGSYVNKDNQKVYTTDVVAEEVEFAESKNSQQQSQPAPQPQADNGFMNIPDDMPDLPFN